MNLPERFLYHIWDARHLIPDLQTISRQKVKILFPGHFNTNFGPDYHHAIIEINGKAKQGDVEIHIRTTDWLAHQHHEDPIYNNVILHVVYEHNGRRPYSLTEKGESIEILEMKPFLDRDISLLVPSSLPIPDCEPLCDFFAGMEPIQVKHVLNHIGLVRLQRRINRFQAESYFNDLEQLTYQCIMEALGYGKNQFPFLILSEQIPLKDVRNWMKMGMTSHELASIFICSSGLDARINNPIMGWNSIFQKQKHCQIRIPCEWNLFRIRPIHHPESRLYQLSGFLFRLGDKKLLAQIHEIFIQNINSSARMLEKAMQSFFGHDEVSPVPINPWGKGLIRLLIINALIPLEILSARKRKDKEHETRIIDMFMRYPGLLENNQMRDMKRFITENQSKQLKGSALRQLGLQQLYRENCKIHDCKSCREMKDRLISNL